MSVVAVQFWCSPMACHIQTCVREIQQWHACGSEGQLSEVGVCLSILSIGGMAQLSCTGSSPAQHVHDGSCLSLKGSDSNRPGGDGHDLISQAAHTADTAATQMCTCVMK